MQQLHTAMLAELSAESLKVGYTTAMLFQSVWQ